QDSTYTNPYGETYTVQRLKYYITNIELVNSKANRRIAVEDSYYLIDDGNDESKIISLPVPEGNYDAISFLLGVDSLHNVSGAQSGALDPMNGMFWTWNSGYVSIKIEGKSPASSLPQNLIEYHLGGFKGPDNVNHRINLIFPRNSKEITNKKVTTIYLKTDLNKFFKSTHSLPIKTNPACTSPGSLARQYSENYATIFSIDTIENR
ncbi:MAG: MbnP family protein, partial [Bacteroidota bacterium]